MAPEPGYRGRFAPSPTGPLHMGSLLAALGSWLHARAAGGQWLVRIDDLDPPREVPGAADAQLATLHAFGLVPDGPVMRQSQRGDAYAQALARLVEAGHAYPCGCSRSALEPFGGRHPPQCLAPAPAGTRCLRLRAGNGQVAFEDGLQGHVRQDLADAGDFVVRRSEGWAAYHLAVVVDDHALGITDVVRGADLLDSTPRQIHLQRLLGMPTPRYWHLPVLLDGDGRKLAKSEGAAALDPADPLPSLGHAWRMLGQDPAAVPAQGTPGRWLEVARAAFEVGRLPRV